MEELSVVHFGGQIKYVDTFVQYELRKLIGRIMGSSFRTHLNSSHKWKIQHGKNVSQIQMTYASLIRSTLISDDVVKDKIERQTVPDTQKGFAAKYLPSIINSKLQKK